MTNTIFHSQYGVKREKSVYWTRCNALQLRALLYLPVSVSTLLILPLCQMPRTLHCPSTALCHCPLVKGQAPPPSKSIFCTHVTKESTKCHFPRRLMSVLTSNYFISQMIRDSCLGVSIPAGSTFMLLSRCSH